MSRIARRDPVKSAVLGGNVQRALGEIRSP